MITSGDEMSALPTEHMHISILHDSDFISFGQKSTVNKSECPHQWPLNHLTRLNHTQGFPEEISLFKQNLYAHVFIYTINISVATWLNFFVLILFAFRILGSCFIFVFQTWRFAKASLHCRQLALQDLMMSLNLHVPWQLVTSFFGLINKQKYSRTQVYSLQFLTHQSNPFHPAFSGMRDCRTLAARLQPLPQACSRCRLAAATPGTGRESAIAIPCRHCHRFWLRSRERMVARVRCNETEEEDEFEVALFYQRAAKYTTKSGSCFKARKKLLPVFACFAYFAIF